MSLRLSHRLGKENADIWVQHLSPRKRFHTVLTTCQSTLQERHVRGQWQGGPHPDWDCLIVHTSVLYLNLNRMSTHLGWTLESLGLACCLTLFPMCQQWIKSFSSAFHCCLSFLKKKNGLFTLHVYGWLPACMYVCVSMCLVFMEIRSIESPGTVTNGCGLPCKCWELKVGPL